MMAVMLEFSIDFDVYGNLREPVRQQRAVNDFYAFVSEHCSHRSVAAWLIGGAPNDPIARTADLVPAFLGVIDALVAAACAAERAAGLPTCRPVWLGLADPRASCDAVAAAGARKGLTDAFGGVFEYRPCYTAAAALGDYVSQFAARPPPPEYAGAAVAEPLHVAGVVITVARARNCTVADLRSEVDPVIASGGAVAGMGDDGDGGEEWVRRIELSVVVGVDSYNDNGYGDAAPGVYRRAPTLLSASATSASCDCSPRAPPPPPPLGRRQRRGLDFRRLRASSRLLWGGHGQMTTAGSHVWWRRARVRHRRPRLPSTIVVVERFLSEYNASDDELSWVHAPCGWAWAAGASESAENERRGAMLALDLGFDEIRVPWAGNRTLCDGLPPRARAAETACVPPPRRGDSLDAVHNLGFDGLFEADLSGDCEAAGLRRRHQARCLTTHSNEWGRRRRRRRMAARACTSSSLTARAGRLAFWTRRDRSAFGSLQSWWVPACSRWSSSFSCAPPREGGGGGPPRPPPPAHAVRAPPARRRARERRARRRRPLRPRAGPDALRAIDSRTASPPNSRCVCCAGGRRLWRR